MIWSLILYTGETPYTASTDFFDLFGANQELARSHWLKPFPLVDVCRLPDPVIEQQRWFGLVELVFKYRHQQAFSDFITRFLQWLDQWEKAGGRELAQAVLYYVMHEFDQGDVSTLLTQAEQFSHELREDTMTIAQQLEQRGLQKGLQQGLQQGLEEGLKEGQARGLQQGLQLMAVKLLRRGMRLEEVRELTGLSLETLHQLQIHEGAD